MRNLFEMLCINGNCPNGRLERIAETKPDEGLLKKDVRTTYYNCSRCDMIYEEKSYIFCGIIPRSEGIIPYNGRLTRGELKAVVPETFGHNDPSLVKIKTRNSVTLRIINGGKR